MKIHIAKNFQEKHHHQAIAVLQDHFRGRETTGIEIGTNAGDLTKALLANVPNLFLLHTIDPYKHTPGAQFEAGNDDNYHKRQIEHARHCLAPFGDHVRIHVMTSDEFFRTNKGLKVDFVWIDGHHEYSHVKRDILNAKDAVLVDGIIGGHDYRLVDDVTKAVGEEFEEIWIGGDFTWFVYV